MKLFTRTSPFTPCAPAILPTHTFDLSLLICSRTADALFRVAGWTDPEWVVSAALPELAVQPEAACWQQAAAEEVVVAAEEEVVAAAMDGVPVAAPDACPADVCPAAAVSPDVVSDVVAPEVSVFAALSAAVVPDAAVSAGSRADAFV